MTEHGVDVIDVERAGSGEAKIDPLKAKLLHVIEQFLLLFNQGFNAEGSAGRHQGLVVEPNLVQVTACIARKLTVRDVPIVDGRVSSGLPPVDDARGASANPREGLKSSEEPRRGHSSSSSSTKPAGRRAAAWSA